MVSTTRTSRFGGFGLKERVNDPTIYWIGTHGKKSAELLAGSILTEAGFITRNGMITLAGMDYYRQLTANPVLTWLRSNWFAVIVAGCTIGVSIFGIVSG